MPPSQGGDTDSNSVGAATAWWCLTPTQQVRSIPAQQFNGVFHLVVDALTLRLHHRPQLKVLDSIVRAYAISMMHELIRPQRPLQEDRHNQAMLGRTRFARQMSKTYRNGNDSVAMVDVADALYFFDRHPSQNIAVLPQAIKMGTAKPSSVGCSSTISDSAVFSFPIRQQACRPLSTPQKGEVMTMTKCSCLAGLWATLNTARLDLTSFPRLGIAVLPPTSVMLVAEPPAHGAVLAVAHRALHEEKVRVCCDRFEEKRASPSSTCHYCPRGRSSGR